MISNERKIVFEWSHYLVPERLLPCYFLARLYLQYEKKEQALQWAEHIVNKEVRIQVGVGFQYTTGDGEIDKRT